MLSASNERLKTSCDEKGVTIAVDTMSGDAGPEAALGAASFVAPEFPSARFMFFGDARVLEQELQERGFEAGADIRHCDNIVKMDDRPREALRRGPDSSMSRALDAVAKGEAHVAVSAGNTAALMTMAAMRLKPSKADAQTPRPAIAALWPSTSKTGAAVVLDMGADIRADSDALVAYAVMGAEYAQAALGLRKPRLALLNVGAERGKGRAEIREAATRLERMTVDKILNAHFIGFVEGDKIPFDAADVIVTDGFTGNVALKSAEGAARLVGAYMKDAFTNSFWGRLGALAAYPALKRLKAKIDPRSVNGGVFLGLDGLVVKSHGAADAIAFASALRLAARLGHSDIQPRIAAQLALTSAKALDPDPTLTARFDAETPAAAS